MAELVRLPEGVDLWYVPLDCASEVIERWASTLDADERARAARFVLSEHGRRYTAARGALRELLGRYLDLPPAEVRFAYGQQGKPYLPGDPFHFNLSHSEELAAVAVAQRPVGVDVERVRPLEDAAAIAERFFSPAECAALRSLPPEAFFHCWARKEAYLKARGDGLTHPLDAFDVAVDPAAPARLLAHRLDPDEPRRWVLRALAPPAGYVGAVAIRSRASA